VISKQDVPNLFSHYGHANLSYMLPAFPVAGDLIIRLLTHAAANRKPFRFTANIPTLAVRYDVLSC